MGGRGTSTYTSERLQEHERHANGHTVAHTLLKKFHELCLLAEVIGTTLFHLRSYLAHLMLNVRMRRIKASDLGQNSLSSVKVVSSSFPSGAFRAPCDTQEKEKTGDELYCERHCPLGCSIDIDCSIAGVVDPEAQHTTAL
jgi:hypothetical protein